MIRIDTKPDMRIDPGHQWLVLPDTPQGNALALLLAQHLTVSKEDGSLLLPHTFAVDATIVDLINALAHVRFSAPALVQITMAEMVDGRDSTLTPDPSPAGRGETEEDGLEGA